MAGVATFVAASGFAAQLMLYRRSGRFARGANDLSSEAVAYLAEQTGTCEADLTLQLRFN